MERGLDGSRGWGGRIWVLHLFVLWSLAVAQPVYDLLGQYPEFFVARRTVPIELVVLVLILTVLGPALLALGLALLKWFSATLFRLSFRAVTTLLAVLALLPVAKRIPAPDLLVVAIALAGGLLVGFLYPRLAALRLFLSYLSPVVVVFPAYFLLFTPVESLLFPGYWTPPADAKTSPESGDRPLSVVIVVLDELALSSLLDEDGQIDALRFPNFAALAAESVWYRNATTVAESTHNALPALATGLYPSVFKQGHSRDYPENIFTWLSATHQLHVFESITQLCPVQLCPPKVKAPWHTRARLLAEDLAIVYGHLVMPELLSRKLPDVSQGWGNFRGADWQLQRSLAFYEGASSLDSMLDELSESRRPALFFYHAPLPHFPWVFLPTGKRYSRNALGSVFLHQDRWVQQPAVIVHAFQRYLLQLGYTDRELGRLMDKFRETGLAEESVLVVLSDHGLNFIPGQPRRSANTSTAREIMPIPLLVRMPGGKPAGVSDINVEIVDLLPTLAELLGMPLPWATDGVSVLDRAHDKPRKLLYKQGVTDPFVFSADLNARTAPAVCLDGQWLRTDSGAIAGSVDHVAIDGEKLAIAGFAADLSASKPADRVLIFVERQLVHIGELGHERKDVVEFYGDAGLINSGFKLHLERSLFPKDSSGEVRFFGQRGQSLSELRYQSQYPWRFAPSAEEEAVTMGERSCQEDTRLAGYLAGSTNFSLGSDPSVLSSQLVSLAHGAGSEGFFRSGPGAKFLGMRPSALPAGTRRIAAQLENPTAFSEVDLGSGFVPAEIDAILEPADLPEDCLVAVALNGVVRAAARPFPFEQAARILTIVPEEHFVDGANQLDFFAVPDQE